MSNSVKVALIAAVTALIITYLIIHNSRYQSCVRATTEMDISQRNINRYDKRTDDQIFIQAKVSCAHNLGD